MHFIFNQASVINNKQIALLVSNPAIGKEFCLSFGKSSTLGVFER